MNCGLSTTHPPCNNNKCFAFSNGTYIEAFGRKTQVHLSDGTIIDCTMSISSFSGKPLKGFVSCHRSYVVNLRFVRSIGKAEITLDSGDNLPLSRRLYKEINEKFIQFYTKG